MQFYIIVIISQFIAFSFSFLHLKNSNLLSNSFCKRRQCTRQSLSMNNDNPYTTVMIVPTGIGAEIGGYAGDALPSLRLIASVSERVITHPNVMNGAMMYWPIANVLYVEGYALDEFSSGKLALQPMKAKKGQKIGLLLDKKIEKSLQLRHLQVADAARATLGLDIHSCVVTKENVEVSIKLSPSGASWGSIENTKTLLDASKVLIDQGCTAIAVVVRFPEDDEVFAASELDSAKMFDDYRKGTGVDAIAGVEALISHVITKEFTIPCAHAPAFSPIEVGTYIVFVTTCINVF